MEKFLKILRSQNRLRGDKSAWWSFIYRWPRDQNETLKNFINGTYRFEPLKSYFIKGEIAIVWTYTDRLFVKALLTLIKPFFKHLISPHCFHLKGPSGVQNALQLTQRALEKESFRYFMRIDIKGYYASIDRKILTQQTQEHFKDPRVLHYLDQIINIPIIRDAVITHA